MASNPEYTPKTGKSFSTGSADGISRALADIADRLGALEATPQGGASSEDGGRLARLEAVVQPFFRDEFSDFDIAASKSSGRSEGDAANGVQS